jgi:hypothetical protein
MDDLDPEIKDSDLEADLDLDGDVDDPLNPGKKKPKAKDDDTLSLDDLADEEDDGLPEDSYDDVEPEDLW